MDSVLLQEAARELINRLRIGVSQVSLDVAIPIFVSGGIDSSVLLSLLASFHPNVVPYTLQFGNYGEDSRLAEELGAYLGLSVKKIQVNPEDLERQSARIIQQFPSASLVHVGITVAMYFGFSAVAQDGHAQVVSGGGGPDELLAGYSRHEQLFAAADYLGLERQLERDATEGVTANLARDTPIAECFGINVLYPYLDPQVVKWCRQLPLQFKIGRVHNQIIRKRILREAGRILALPEAYVNRPKKAIQYSTGVSMLLRKQAKKEGFPNIKGWIEARQKE